MSSMISEASRDMCLTSLFKEYVKLAAQISVPWAKAVSMDSCKNTIYETGRKAIVYDERQGEKLLKNIFASVNLFQILSFNHL